MQVFCELLACDEQCLCPHNATLPKLVDLVSMLKHEVCIFIELYLDLWSSLYHMFPSIGQKRLDISYNWNQIRHTFYIVLTF